MTLSELSQPGTSPRKAQEDYHCVTYQGVLLGLLAVGTGILVLVGWAWDISTIKGVFPGSVFMKANTAAGFVLSGLALVLWSCAARMGPGRYLALACAGATALVGLLTLIQYVLHVDLGIDQLLFRATAGVGSTLIPGRMTPAAALSLLMLGGALFCVGWRRTLPLAQGLALLAGLIGLLSLMGHLYGATARYGVGQYTQTAIHTAVLFMLVSLGVFVLHPADGLMRTTAPPTMGGWLLRRMMPFAFGVPLSLGWLRVQGERRGYFEGPLGVALMMATMMFLLTLLVWWAARKLTHMETMRQQSDAELRQSLANLKAIFSSSPVGMLLLDEQTMIVDANDALGSMVSRSMSQIIRKHGGGGGLGCIHGLEGCGHAKACPSCPLRNCLTQVFKNGTSIRKAEIQPTLLINGKEARPWLSVSAEPVRLNGHPHVIVALEDISERKRAEEALRESERQFMAVLYTASDAILLIENQTFVDCNEATVKMLGYRDKQEVLQTHPSVLSPPVQPDGRSSAEKADAMMGTALQEGFHRFEWTHRKADGADFPVEVSLSVIVVGGKTQLHCVWRDITKIKEAERQLRESNRHLAELNHNLEATATQIKGLMTDVVSKNVFSGRFVNRGLAPCWETNMCLKTACPAHRNQDNLRCWEVAGTHCTGKVQGKFAQKLGDCTQCEIFQNSRGSPIKDLGETFNTMLAILEDRHQELLHTSFHDALTGLPNRALFLDRLQQAVLRTQRHKGHHFAVLFLDFDRFKIINDSLGHGVGDMLLQEIARRLGAAVRAGDTASGQNHTTARLGGDEFVVLLDGLSHPEDAVIVARRLLEVFAQPYHLGEHDVYSTASIGIVTSALTADSAEQVLRDADTAMYEAKLAGKGQYVVFSAPMRQRVQMRLNMENDLRKALDAGQLFLTYQPIVSLQSGLIERFEVLLRWQHPERGLISPTEFIPIAEETGLILPIGEWVLRQACAQHARWRQSLGTAAPRALSVNLSRTQLLLRSLPDTIKGILEETGMPASCLHLEVTESAVMRDAAASVRTLQAIKAIGVKLEMDDFGTGYSSLACLHQFPIDVLKIDRAFIANIDRGRDYAALVHAITQLARNLNIQVVAEGIETPDQAVILQSLECEFGQGYLFSKPLVAEEAALYKVPEGVWTLKNSVQPSGV